MSREKACWSTVTAGMESDRQARRKGYAVQMLWLALPLLRGKGVCTAVITCDRNNLASASTILRCKGIEAGEILDPDTGGINRIFKICLSDG